MIWSKRGSFVKIIHIKEDKKFWNHYDRNYWGYEIMSLGYKDIFKKYVFYFENIIHILNIFIDKNVNLIGMYTNIFFFINKLQEHAAKEIADWNCKTLPLGKPQNLTISLWVI